MTCWLLNLKVDYKKRMKYSSSLLIFIPKYTNLKTEITFRANKLGFIYKTDFGKNTFIY